MPFKLKNVTKKKVGFRRSISLGKRYFLDFECKINKCTEFRKTLNSLKNSFSFKLNRENLFSKNFLLINLSVNFKNIQENTRENIINFGGWLNFLNEALVLLIFLRDFFHFIFVAFFTEYSSGF